MPDNLDGLNDQNKPDNTDQPNDTDKADDPDGSDHPDMPDNPNRPNDPDDPDGTDDLDGPNDPDIEGVLLFVLSPTTSFNCSLFPSSSTLIQHWYHQVSIF